MDQDQNRLAGPDFVTSLIFMAAGVIIAWASLRMPIFNRTIIVSPGLFPAIIGVVFVVFGGVIFWLALRRGGAGRALRMFSAETLAAVSRSPRFHRGMIVFAAILVYVLLFGNSWLARLNFGVDAGFTRIPVNVGFLVATGGYLLFNFIYLKAMSLPAAAALSLAAASIVFYVFNLGFGIPIP